MLSRTAAGLYWLSRHLERAENTARMLDVTFSMSMMPNAHIVREEQTAPLRITGTLQQFFDQHEHISMNKLMHFFTLDESNSASIFASINAARDNAKAVRGKISSETWEAINSSWIELQKIKRRGNIGDTSRFLDWIKERSHTYRGAIVGTALRNDAFRFSRLGTFLERADNTARILDVKYQLDDVNQQSRALEYYRWNAVLRSLGAFEAYREIYKDKVTPRRVAELLILRGEVPRSIRSCLEAITRILEQIEGDAGTEVKRLANVQYARVRYADAHFIFKETGLHEYLIDFLQRINALGDSIHRHYLEAL